MDHRAYIQILQTHRIADRHQGAFRRIGAWVGVRQLPLDDTDGSDAERGVGEPRPLQDDVQRSGRFALERHKDLGGRQGVDPLHDEQKGLIHPVLAWPIVHCLGNS